MNCWECHGTMHKTTSKFKGMEFEAWNCPKCKKTIFTEEQARTVAQRLDQKNIAQEYVKSPMKIGSSYGITFPKALVDYFQLDKKKKMKLIPNLSENKIVIELEE